MIESPAPGIIAANAISLLALYTRAGASSINKPPERECENGSGIDPHAVSERNISRRNRLIKPTTQVSPRNPTANTNHSAMLCKKTWTFYLFIYLFIHICPQKEDACQGLDYFFFFLILSLEHFLLFSFFEKHFF